MKKYLAVATIAIMVFGLTNPVFAAKKSKQMMSFGFFQEMAGITPQGEIRADIYGAGLLPTDIRIGAFGGEVMIDTATGGNATGIGYKHPLNRKMAIYGSLFYSNVGAGTTNIAGGFAYTTVSNGLILNGNANLLSAGGTTTLTANGAVFYPMSQRKVSGKVFLGGELALQLSPTNTTGIFAGLRWMPKRNLIVDTGLISSTGVTTNIATPVFVRLNIGL